MKQKLIWIDCENFTVVGVTKADLISAYKEYAEMIGNCSELKGKLTVWDVLAEQDTVAFDSDKPYGISHWNDCRKCDKVKYRVKVNYVAIDNDEYALETSSPHYTLGAAVDEIIRVTGEKCADNKDVDARISIWKYTKNGLVEIWANRENPA